MDMVKYREIIEQIRVSIDISDSNMMEKNEKLPSLYQKVLRIYSNVSSKYNQYIIIKDKKYGELYEHYKYNDSKSWSSKIEIESQILRDASYCKILLRIRKYEVILKELEMSLKNIHNTLFVIKNLIEYRKIFGV